MVQPDHERLSVREQCELLDLSRSGYYYEPVEVSREELSLMQRIDRLHLDSPFFGSRQLRFALRQEGIEVNRKPVGQDSPRTPRSNRTLELFKWEGTHRGSPPGQCFGGGAKGKRGSAVVASCRERTGASGRRLRPSGQWVLCFRRPRRVGRVSGRGAGSA